MRKFIIFGIAGLLFISSCEKDIASIEKGNFNAPRKVLIVGQSSQFKQDIIKKVIEKLGTQDYYFKIIGLTELDKADSAQYGAILIVSAYMAGQLDQRVKQFLLKNPSDPKVIVFYTRGSEGPTPEWAKSFKVDMVSSASSQDRLDKHADQLSSLIIKKF